MQVLQVSHGMPAPSFALFARICCADRHDRSGYPPGDPVRDSGSAAGDRNGLCFVYPDSGDKEW